MKPGTKAMLSETAPLSLQSTHGNLAVLTLVRMSDCGEPIMRHDITQVEFLAQTEHVVFISDADAKVQARLYADAIDFATTGKERVE